MSKMEVDARFLDAELDVEGLGKSNNSGIGRVPAGFPNARRHALGKAGNGPALTGRPLALYKRVEKAKNRPGTTLQSLLV